MINERIRFPQVRVVDEENQQIGVMTTREAIAVAQDRGLDLVLVAPEAQPPVCRVISWGKYKYEKTKKRDGTRKAQNELKMIRLHPRTGVHDRDILIRHADRFLHEGHKVRVVCQFKGRENAYPELGRQQMDAISGALAEYSNIEGQVTKQGRDMTMMLVPKPGLKPKVKAPTLAQEEDDAKFAAMQERLAAESETDDDGDVNEGENETPASKPEPAASDKKVKKINPRMLNQLEDDLM